MRYAIPHTNISTFLNDLARLAKRASRLGLAAPVWREEKVRKVDTKDGGVTLVHEGELDPGCDTPVLAGWTFLATLDHSLEGALVRVVPGQSCPVQYRDRGPVCDHCGHNRRRNTTYVLRHEDGRTVQVGSTCINDFLGSVSATQLAACAEYLSDLDALGLSLADSEGGFGFGHGTHLRLEAFLGTVARVIAAVGWTSKRKAREAAEQDRVVPTTTADHAYWVLFPKEAPKGWKNPLPKESEQAVDTLAADALAWAEALTDEQCLDNDYLHNLRVLARRGVAEKRDLGLAASLVPTYQRHLEAQKKARDAQVSTHQGMVGEQLVRTVRVEKVIRLEGAYGVTKLHVMYDAAGNAFKWFSSSDVLPTNEWLDVVGTVKAHEVYAKTGERQTILTRCSRVTMRVYTLTVKGRTEKVTTYCPVLAAKMLKQAHGVARLPKGAKVEEEASA